MVFSVPLRRMGEVLLVKGTAARLAAYGVTGTLPPEGG
jgi:hypothetical protein